MSDTWDAQSWETPLVWEMPSKVTSMETIDGRLMVTLEDGRTINMTDAFADQPTRQ